MDLSGWLIAEQREPSPSVHFSVCDIRERDVRPVELVSTLALAVVNAKTSTEFLAAVEPYIDWDFLSRRLGDSPAKSVFRGDFGEVLAGAWLEDHDKLVPTIRKLRYQILPSQTQPGADIVAVELRDGVVDRLHLVEVKLRTTRNTSSAVDAHLQHERRPSAQLEALLIFILERLWDDNSELFGPLLDHLAGRTYAPDDVFHIFLVYDDSTWSDHTLTRLDDSAGSLEPLDVHVLRVRHLAELIADAFDAIGVEVIADPDDEDDPEP
jgi:hypothetical protein